MNDAAYEGRGKWMFQEARSWYVVAADDAPDDPTAKALMLALALASDLLNTDRRTAGLGGRLV